MEEVIPKDDRLASVSLACKPDSWAMSLRLLCLRIPFLQKVQKLYWGPGKMNARAGV